MLLALGYLGETGLAFVVFEVELFHFFDAVNVRPQFPELSTEQGQSPIKLMHFLRPIFGLLNRLIDFHFLLLGDLPLKIGQQLRILRLQILHNLIVYFPLLHLPQTLLMPEHNLQKRGLIHRFPLVDLTHPQQQRRDEIIDHFIVKLL